MCKRFNIARARCTRTIMFASFTQGTRDVFLLVTNLVFWEREEMKKSNKDGFQHTTLYFYLLGSPHKSRWIVMDHTGPAS